MYSFQPFIRCETMLVSAPLRVILIRCDNYWYQLVIIASCAVLYRTFNAIKFVYVDDVLKC